MRILLPISLTSMLLLTACGQDQEMAVLSTPDLASEGHVKVELMDAPFPLELVDSTSVTITDVGIQVVTADSGPSGLRITNRDERILNLLDLRNGATEILFDADAPTGKITRLRLRLDHASVTLVDGRSLDTIFPTGLEGGIELFPTPPIEVGRGLVTELLLDFDLSRSLVPIPKAADETHEIRHFMLQPAFRLVNRATAGSISGSVFGSGAAVENARDDAPLADGTVMAFLGHEEVTGTSTEEDGSYRLMGLEGSLHRLVAFAKGFEPDTLWVQVMIGNDLGNHDFHLDRIKSE
jgi:hypothetical protein